MNSSINVKDIGVGLNSGGYQVKRITVEMDLDVIQEIYDRIKKTFQPPSCNMGHIGVGILENA